MTNGGVCLRETGELMDLIVAALWHGEGGENIPPSHPHTREIMKKSKMGLHPEPDI